MPESYPDQPPQPDPGSMDPSNTPGGAEAYPDHIGVAAEPRGDRDVSHDAHFTWHDSNTGAIVAGVFDGYGASGHELSQEARKGLQEVVNGSGADLDMSTTFGALSARLLAHPSGRNGGSTAVVTAIQHGKLRWGAVGDSSGWVIRGDEVIPFTTPQTQFHDTLDRLGAHRPAEDDVRYKRLESYATVVTSALGQMYQSGRLQTGEMDVQEGDYVVLVTDGVTGNTKAQAMEGGNVPTILDVVRADMSVAQKAQALLEASGQNDDKTAIVVGVPAALAA